MWHLWPTPLEIFAAQGLNFPRKVGERVKDGVIRCSNKPTKNWPFFRIGPSIFGIKRSIFRDSTIHFWNFVGVRWYRFDPSTSGNGLHEPRTGAPGLQPPCIKTSGWRTAIFTKNTLNTRCQLAHTLPRNVTKLSIPLVQKTQSERCLNNNLKSTVKAMRLRRLSKHQQFLDT